MNGVFRELKREIELFDSKNPNFPPHIHNATELLYVKSGRGKAYCNGEEYTLKSGSFFIAFPNQVHHYSEFDDGCDATVLIVDPGLLVGYAEIFDEKAPAFAHYESGAEDENLLILLKIAKNEYRTSKNKPFVISLITAFFGMLLTRFELIENVSTSDCTSKILGYCKRHYKEDISVQDVGEALNISRSHISHIFSERLKIGFCDYINSLRINYSVRLMESKERSISEVALSCGFSTIRSFNRAFRKIFGCTPREYRKRTETK